jgi:hypothetical protein
LSQKKTKDQPPQPKHFESLWERREEHGPRGSPVLRGFPGDVDSICERLRHEWETTIRGVFADYLAYEGEKAYQDRLEEVCRRKPVGLRDAYSIIQSALPEFDWSLYTLPFTVQDLLDVHQENPVPNFCELAENGIAPKDLSARVSAWNELMDPIDAISENTIIQSADGQYLALYFKAGLTITEAGKPVLNFIGLIPADFMTYLSPCPWTSHSTLLRVCRSSRDQLFARLGRTGRLPLQS